MRHPRRAPRKYRHPHDGPRDTTRLRRECGPYRDRHGWFLGVCSGLATHLGMPVNGLRIGFLVGLLFTGFWPLFIAYVVAAFLMRPAPIVPLETEEDAEFYNSYANSRGMALHRLKRTFDNLDRRIQRMEDIVTDKEYDWDRRFGEEN